MRQTTSQFVGGNFAVLLQDISADATAFKQIRRDVWK